MCLAMLDMCLDMCGHVEQILKCLDMLDTHFRYISDMFLDISTNTSSDGGRRTNNNKNSCEISQASPAQVHTLFRAPLLATSWKSYLVFQIHFVNFGGQSPVLAEDDVTNKTRKQSQHYPSLPSPRVNVFPSNFLNSFTLSHMHTSCRALPDCGQCLKHSHPQTPTT